MAEYGLHRGEASRRGWYGGTYGDRPAWSEPWLAVPPAKAPAEPKPKKSGFWSTVFEIGKGLTELGVYLANSSMPFVSGPVTDAGNVFAWDNRMMLCCWDALTGAPKWRVGEESFNFIRLNPGPAAGGGLVVTCSLGMPKLRAYDAATGAELWSRGLPASGTSALLLGGVAYVGDGTGCLGAYRLADGKPMWSAELSTRSGQSGQSVEVAAPASDRHVIYLAWERGIAAVEATSGRILWMAKQGGVSSTTVAVFGGFVYTVGTMSPSGDGDESAVACITAFRADKGRRVWQRDLADWAFSSVAVGSGLVIAGDNAGVIHAFDAANGQPHWTHTLGGPVRHPVSIAGNTVFAGCKDNGLYALDIGTGRPRWRYEAAAPVVGAPAIAHGFAYFTDSLGMLYAVDAASGRGPDHSAINA